MTTSLGPIIAAVDGSDPALDAVRWAARAATRQNRPLRIVSVVEPMGFAYGNAIPAAQAYADGSRAFAEGSLDVALSEAREIAPGIESEGEIIEGRPSLVLRQLSHRAHLMVVGRRGLGGVQGLLLGSVSSDLAAHAECAVVVVSDDPPISGPVVVGADASPVSAPAVTTAFAMASALSAPLIAVHTYADYPGISSFDLVEHGRQQLLDEARENLGSQLAGALEDYPEVTVDTVVSMQPAAEQLLESARNAQLIVVGSRGRGGFRSMLLGSTSQAVLQVAQCPVMIVPH